MRKSSDCTNKFMRKAAKSQKFKSNTEDCKRSMSKCLLSCRCIRESGTKCSVSSMTIMSSWSKSTSKPTANIKQRTKELGKL